MPPLLIQPSPYSQPHLISWDKEKDKKDKNNDKDNDKDKNNDKDKDKEKDKNNDKDKDTLLWLWQRDYRGLLMPPRPSPATFIVLHI